jgi:hypothetical protein
MQKSKGNPFSGSPSADWGHIEHEYRAGTRLLKDIAEDNGIGYTAIVNRAKRFGWTREGAQRVQVQSIDRANAVSYKVRSKKQKIEAQALRAAVTELHTDRSKQVAMLASDVKRASGELQISQTAELIAGVRLSHRALIERARNLASGLLSELEQQTHKRDEFARMVELLEASGSVDEEGMLRMQKFLQGAMSTGGRIDSTKKLADTLGRLIELERTAFNIDASPVDERQKGAVHEFLTALKRSALPVVQHVPYIDVDAQDVD